jgi:hypothetical protein
LATPSLEEQLGAIVGQAVVPTQEAARQAAGLGQLAVQGRAQVGLGPTEIHRVLGEAAHESDVLGDVVQSGLGLEDQKVVAGDDAGVAAGLQGLPHGGDRNPSIQVVGPALRGVFHTDVETNHAQPGQAAREIRRDGIGPALAHESRALHARFVERTLDGPDARQTVSRPGQ